jgi:hypothetical protein
VIIAGRSASVENGIRRGRNRRRQGVRQWPSSWTITEARQGVISVPAAAGAAAAAAILSVTVTIAVTVAMVRDYGGIRIRPERPER